MQWRRSETRQVSDVVLVEDALLLVSARHDAIEFMRVERA